MAIAAYIILGVVVLFLGVVVLFVGLAVWGRRGEGWGDKPGTRTTCQFSGPTWTNDGDPDSGIFEGRALLDAICTQLAASGVNVGNVEMEDCGWEADPPLSQDIPLILIEDVALLETDELSVDAVFTLQLSAISQEAIPAEVEDCRHRLWRAGTIHCAQHE